MESVRVCLEGERYAKAYLALRRAQYAWHRLDAALVSAKHLENQNPDLSRASDALTTLDRQLAHLRALLVS